MSYWKTKTECVFVPSIFISLLRDTHKHHEQCSCRQRDIGSGSGRQQESAGRRARGEMEAEGRQQTERERRHLRTRRRAGELNEDAIELFQVNNVRAAVLRNANTSAVRAQEAAAGARSWPRGRQWLAVRRFRCLWLIATPIYKTNRLL